MLFVVCQGWSKRAAVAAGSILGLVRWTEIFTLKHEREACEISGERRLLVRHMKQYLQAIIPEAI